MRFLPIRAGNETYKLLVFNMLSGFESRPTHQLFFNNSHMLEKLLVPNDSIFRVRELTKVYGTGACHDEHSQTVWSGKISGVQANWQTSFLSRYLIHRAHRVMGTRLHNSAATAMRSSPTRCTAS